MARSPAGHQRDPFSGYAPASPVPRFGAYRHRHGRPVQRIQLGEQVRLVAQHLNAKVAVLDLAQEGGVATLGMQTVGGDHGRVQLQWLQQRPERRYLVTLVGDLPLGQHHSSVGDRRQQVWCLAIGTPGAPDDVAFHGQPAATVRRAFHVRQWYA